MTAAATASDYDYGSFGVGNGGVGVGVSDAIILTVSLIGFVILAGTVYSIILMRVQTRDEFDKEQQDKELNYGESLQHADVATLSRAQRRARANFIMKQQRRAAALTAGTGAPGDRDPDALQHDLQLRQQAGAAADATTTTLTSRKERIRAAKEAERMARQVNQQERRQQQKEVLEVAKEQKRLRQEKQARALEEAKVKSRQTKQQEERAAYEQWRTFLVSQEEERMTVVEFHEYCKQNRRVVNLHALSERFRVSLPAVKKRLQQLVDTRRLTGIILQESNMFLYMTDQELEQVASFLVLEQQEGNLEKLAPKLTQMLLATATE